MPDRTFCIFLACGNSPAALNYGKVRKIFNSMPQIDLANIKTRLIGFGAVMTVGQVIASVLGGPGAEVAAGMIGGPIAVVGVSALSQQCIETTRMVKICIQIIGFWNWP